MSERNDGGPAFPCDNDPTPNDFGNLPESGMSLRDYFAAKAMQGICAGHEDPQPYTWKQLAEWSYLAAEAMLVQREK